MTSRVSKRWIFCLMILAGAVLLPAGCSSTPDEQLMQEVKGLPSGTYAVIHTNRGDFVARLYVDRVPGLAANFIGLAEGVKPFTDPRTHKEVSKPFYDGLLFFQTEPNTYILTGDPLDLGHGGPGFELAPEYHPDVRHDKPGILSMRLSNSKTVASQFYIMIRPAPEFDDYNCPFGELVTGLDLAKEFSFSPRYRGVRPVRDMKVIKLRIFRVNSDGSIELSPKPEDDAFLMGPVAPNEPRK